MKQSRIQTVIFALIILILLTISIISQISLINSSTAAAVIQTPYYLPLVVKAYDTDSTPIPINELDIGTLSPFQLEFEQLNNNEIHVWTLDLQANESITISVAAQPSVNTVLTLVDPVGSTIISQNIAAAGEIEILANQPITETGMYKLQITTINNISGAYVVSFYTNENSSVPIIFKDILIYGDTSSDTLTAETDDYWHFYGNCDDSVTITVTPNSSSADLFITLWAATDDIAESDEPVGATETITLTLPSDGMYTIQVADWDFLEQGYEISLIQN
ncbi:MAG: hypothetical protein GY943_34625 [Chloroflexi bacterium]|nr:hypothetical protein [Chloroflexota bacterium]